MMAAAAAAAAPDGVGGAPHGPRAANWDSQPVFEPFAGHRQALRPALLSAR